MDRKVRITYEELHDPTVDQVLKRKKEEEEFRRGARTASEELKKTSLIHKSWFNLMIAGVLGGFIAWAILEPNFDDYNLEESQSFVIFMLLALGGLVLSRHRHK